MATKKKSEAAEAEAKEAVKAEAPVNQEIFDLENLYKMKFRDGYGNVVMVRKAYKPRGKLEMYAPAAEG